MATHGLGLRTLAQTVSATFGRQVAAALLNLATMALIARIYGPVGNGVYALAILLPSSLTTILNLGVAPANVYFLGSSQVSLPALLRANLQIFVGLSILGGSVGAAVVALYGASLFPNVDPALLWLALGTFPIALLNGYLLSMFQGLQRFQAYNLLVLGQPSALLLLVVALVITGNRELVLLIAATLAAKLLVLSFTTTMLRPLVGRSRDHRNTRSFVARALNYGWKAHLSNILAFVKHRTDIFLVNLFLGPVSVGVYVVAVAASEKLWMVSQAVSTVLLPRLSQLTSAEAKRRQLTPLVTRWVLTVTLLGAVVLAALSQPVIELVFGLEYSQAVVPLWLLLPGIVCGSAARILANDLAARGRPELNLYTSICVVIVNIVGNLYLIPRYGLAGAASATSLAYVLNLSLRVMVYNRLAGSRWQDTLLLRVSDIAMVTSRITETVGRYRRVG